MPNLGLINLISQPVCVINKVNKGITFGNPAMLKALNVVGRSFDVCFSFIDNNITFQSLTSSIISESPVLMKLLKSKSDYSFYYGHLTNKDNENVILLLTPCLLKQYIIDNSFLRNHESLADCLENAPLAIHISETNGQVLWANDFTHKLTGCDQGKLTGRNISDVSILVISIYNNNN